MKFQWVVVAVAASVLATLLLVGTIAKQHIDRKVTDALAAVGAILDQKTGDVLVSQRRIAENLHQAETVNTERSRTLSDELKRLQRENRALQAELERIGGQVTAISRSVSEIAISGADTTSVHPDSVSFRWPYRDPWLTALIERNGPTVGFSYQTTFQIEEFDVEVTLPGGSKTHLFNTALVSTTTGDTLHVPTRRTVIERLSGEKRRFLVFPRPHLAGAGGLGQAWAGGGVSFLTLGKGRYIEATDFYLLGAYVFTDGNGFTIGASPATFNAGRVLPFVNNLSIGPVWMWGEHQSGIGLVIGAAL